MPTVDWDQDAQGASSGTFEPIPAGRYLCLIKQTDQKDTRNKTGKYVEVEFEVMKGNFQRRKLWARLNVHNQSAEAQRIGREQFNALKLAAGKERVEATEELHGKLVVCIVAIEDGNRGPQNQVTGFLQATAQDSKNVSSSAPPARTRPAATSAGSAKPAGKLEDIDDDIPF